MSRRTRRVLPLLLPAVLVLGISGCGDDDGGGGSDSDSGAALDSVQIAGEFGSAPEVTFDGEVEADEVTTEVVSEGDGAEVAKGDQVLTHIWIGNGFTQDKSFSTYDAKKAELLTVDEKQLSAVFVEGLEGQTIGSRVAVAASAEVAFGPQGNPQLQIGNKDSVVAILDLLSTVPAGPEGDAVPAPSWAPKLVEKGGTPTGFDFAGTPAPSSKLRSATLIQGTGPEVEKGQTIAVDYLGQVYQGKKPFDESYGAQPVAFGIGVGQVVPGWDKSLLGVKVGSRMLLSIPPEDGYGKQGNESAGIKGTDTLFFVVDILAAA